MSFRQQLNATTSQNPEALLMIWRQERAFRIGKALCYCVLILSIFATIADFFWSDIYVFATDFVLMSGSGLTLYWLNSHHRPHYFWYPLFIGFWVSTIPTFFSTGGIESPFFALDLIIFYMLGAVLDTRHSPLRYFIFSILHLPVFLLIENFYPLSVAAPLSPFFTALISGLSIFGAYICLSSLLRTEMELSYELVTHYRNLGQTEHELKKQELQLREAQAIANVGNWEWDIKKDHISWSDELFKIYEVDKSTFEPSFSSYLARLDPALREKTQAILRKAALTGEDFSFENRVTTSAGVRFVSSRGRVIRDDDGQAIKMFGTSQDITDRKNIESLLLEARSELEKRVEERTIQLEESLAREKAATRIAEEASQAKMQFLANMSHEIRTPMNSILGFSDLMASENLAADEIKDYLARIRANGKQLLHLIDDILDLSKFEAGRIPIQKSAFSLRTLINEVVNSFAPSLIPKGLKLDLSFQEGPSPQIFTDSSRLSQILTNLLSNSVKFSNHGTISIAVNYTKLESNRLSVTIDVKDAGMGMSVESQKNLFRPFSQGDTSIARRFGGSGLGLALSKHIAKALDGDLELVSSVPGKGSHFRLQFIVEQIKEQKASTAANRPRILSKENNLLQNKKILLVEDSSDNAFLICHYLKPFGADVDLASDGGEAVEKVEQKNYDCILMDIQMPGMDGLEATRKIRSLGFKNPVIALTAHALPTEAQRSLEAGCDLHLTKPISRDILIGSLSAQFILSKDSSTSASVPTIEI